MTNYAFTEKGGLQYESSGNYCLDFFARVGAVRQLALNGGQDYIWKLFCEAYKADKETAMKILFWARWCRGGAGERATFHIIFEKLCSAQPAFIVDNLSALVNYGYWKDLVPYLSDLYNLLRGATLQHCNFIITTSSSFPIPQLY